MIFIQEIRNYYLPKRWKQLQNSLDRNALIVPWKYAPEITRSFKELLRARRNLITVAMATNKIYTQWKVPLCQMYKGRLGLVI